MIVVAPASSWFIRISPRFLPITFRTNSSAKPQSSNPRLPSGHTDLCNPLNAPSPPSHPTPHSTPPPAPPQPPPPHRGPKKLPIPHHPLQSPIAPPHLRTHQTRKLPPKLLILILLRQSMRKRTYRYQQSLNLMRQR